LTKDAGILTLIYRPRREFSAQLSGSLELNDARIFGQDERGALQEYVQNNPQRLNTFRVPEGTTLAVAERVSATWDRRDVPLDATQGTLLSTSVEHVQANPVGEDARQGAADPNDVFAATKSHFMRYTGRVAGYVRLSQRGLALAASFRMGVIQQLTSTSRTYPDRLFFMGGVDSIRGFLQDSLVPEDVAEELLRPGTDLTLREVVIRGGDLFVNHRLELRIPLTGSLQTAFFLDAGNLWTDPARIEPFDLRYAAGSGLRVATPIGPLVFDYGFNVQRILDSIDSSRSMQRFWEDLGAFHFSIGVF
jgi:outer membrane protein assembly factor BamA